MKGSIFSLAFQGVRRKKKSSILIFLVLLLSFAFAIASLSLLGSMSKTNAEFRLNTYGEWYFAVPCGMEQDAGWLEKQPWVEAYGTSKSYGTVAANRPTGFGTVDDNLKKVGRLKLDDGSWPTKPNEIAMEADVLGLLGYDYTLGQEIDLMIEISGGGSSCLISRSYTLCGIIREYTDLWQQNRNPAVPLLNGAIVTQEAAEQFLEEARLQLSEQRVSIKDAALQYYITVAPENRETGKEKLQENLTQGRAGHPFENTLAYIDGIASKTASDKPDPFFIILIAAVALLAVLCIYIMQLPAEIHSFAILRSIGITRGQMAGLLFTESLFLCLPAILLGVPLGIGLTWLSLNLAMYSGSVAVQVAIPFGPMLAVMGLWVIMILLSRLIVFGVTVRTPLTGRMQLQQGKSRRAKRLRSGFIFLLLAVFGGTAIFTALEAIPSQVIKEDWLSFPPYEISVRTPREYGNDTVRQETLDRIEQLPGVTNAVGYSPMEIAVSFDGQEIGRSSWDDFSTKLLYLYNIDSADWEEIFDFGADREAFDAGELVLLCFPGRDNPYQLKDGYPLPSTEKIQIRAYAGFLYKEHGKGKPVDPKPELLFESDSVPVSIQYPPYSLRFHWFNYDMPYTVLCSNAFIEKLLSGQEEGYRWEHFSVGQEIGYVFVNAYADKNAEDYSTDKVMASFCRQNALNFDNRRQQYAAAAQASLQRLILLCSTGISIALMALLICFGALSLETEQEKRYFGTMRVIGMSSRQMTWKIVGKALLRSLTALSAGWIFYIGYAAALEVRYGNGFWGFVSRIRNILIMIDHGGLYVLGLSFLCLLLPLILSLFAKRKLKKESRL